jgi:tRNA threonylcarbamoyladenosine biosynthesis protein TsaE
MHLLLPDLSATQRFGICFADCINEYALVALEGTLGAGKTTLVKSIGHGLGVREIISSPTFTMLNEYHSGRLPLFHLDIYRGGETGETMDLDTLAEELDELLGVSGVTGAAGAPRSASGVALIEWAKYFLCEGHSFFDGRDYLNLHLGFGSGSQGLGVEDPERYTRVLRPGMSPENLEDPQNKYIKDGFTDSRIATLSANGPKSADLLAELSGKLSDMVINL